MQFQLLINILTRRRGTWRVPGRQSFRMRQRYPIWKMHAIWRNKNMGMSCDKYGQKQSWLKILLLSGAVRLLATMSFCGSYGVFIKRGLSATPAIPISQHCCNFFSKTTTGLGRPSHWMVLLKRELVLRSWRVRSRKKIRSHKRYSDLPLRLVQYIQISNG